MKECTWCGNDLEPDEIESPRLDNDGDPICDDCYHDNFEFTCCKCEEYAPLSERDDVGSLLVIVDEEETRLPTGIYEIVNHPYWSSDMLSSEFINSAIKRVSDNTFGIGERLDYPAGHLCRRCQDKVRETLGQERP